MAFCSSNRQFLAGWYGGGNRRRFEELTASETVPIGVVALLDDEPVGWCSCGPRSRYTAAIAGRSQLLAQRPRVEDQDVWLAACIFVRPGHRGAGIPKALVQEAVLLAQNYGGSAIEAWPLTTGTNRRAEAHVGREEMFAELGFRSIRRLGPDRAFMRLEFAQPHTL